MRRGKPKTLKTLVRCTLGPLEEEVMRALCGVGRRTVRDVYCALDRRFAYTTVMTTVDRLYQKGLLKREVKSKAYVYHSALTSSEFDTQMAHDLISAFLFCRRATGQVSRELVDAIIEFDPSLLVQVEDEIRLRRTVSRHRFDSSAATIPSLADALPFGHA